MSTREEAETIINWTSADGKATVYSLMPKVWRQCIRAGGVEINHERGVREGKKVARTFLVDPGCIFIRKLKRKNLTAEQRAQIGERLRTARSRPEGMQAVGAGNRKATEESPEAS